MEAVIFKVGMWLYNIFPLILGSAISVFVGRKKMAELSKQDIWLTFIFGIGIAWLFGGVMLNYFDVDKKSDEARAIYGAIAFIGMAILTEVQIQVPLAITAMRKKWLGE